LPAVPSAQEIGLYVSGCFQRVKILSSTACLRGGQPPEERHMPKHAKLRSWIQLIEINRRTIART
jgi:hypothetical protein